MVTFKEAEAVQKKIIERRDLWEAGMNGVGIASGLSVKLNFEHGPIPDLPSEIDGVKIHAEIVGPIYLL